MSREEMMSPSFVVQERVAEPPTTPTPNPPVIMSTSTSTSLDSIVSFPKRIQRWDKLEDDEELVELHAKFWGKEMVQEEASGQTSDLSEREVLDVDESIKDDTDERMEDDTDEGMDDDTDERMEDDNDESIEDDIKTGYVLVLDNEAFPNKKIWVRVSAFTQGEIGTIHEFGRLTISVSTTTSWNGGGMTTTMVKQLETKGRHQL
jgi:hypothetical protein